MTALSNVENLRIETEHDKFLLQDRLCNLSYFSHVPTKRTTTFDRTCYNVPKDFNVRTPLSTYDRLFTHAIKPGYDQKLHRCDREHAKLRGLRTNDEEHQKVVPTLYSSVYGHPHHAPYDMSSRDHVRVARVKAEFYRNNDINVKPDETADELA